MVRNAYVSTAETFIYTAKSLATSATCKIRIVDMDGTKTVDDTAMTEIEATNAPGRYKYAWTPTAEGTYTVYKFEGSFASPTWLQIEEVVVGGSVSRYTTPVKVATFMGLRDGITRLTFSGSTLPTVTEVNSIIDQAQDFIDQYTGHAWRSVTVTEEVYDYVHPRDIGYYARTRDNRCICLNHRSIRTISSSDKIEVWTGSAWKDYVADYTEARGSDYWLDYDKGVIFFGDHYPHRESSSVRVTFRYGESSVPADIERAATLYVAMQLAASMDNLVVAGTEFDINPRDKMKVWEDQMLRILLARKEM